MKMTLNQILSEVPKKVLTTEEISECFELLREPFKVYGNVKEVMKALPDGTISSSNRHFDGRAVGFRIIEDGYGYVIQEPYPDPPTRIEYWQKSIRLMNYFA